MRTWRRRASPSSCGAGRAYGFPARWTASRRCCGPCSRPAPCDVAWCGPWASQSTLPCPVSRTARRRPSAWPRPAGRGSPRWACRLVGPPPSRSSPAPWRTAGCGSIPGPMSKRRGVPCSRSPTWASHSRRRSWRPPCTGRMRSPHRVAHSAAPQPPRARTTSPAERTGGARGGRTPPFTSRFTTRNPVIRIALVVTVAAALALALSSRPARTDDAATVAALDAQYRAAVRSGDVATMDRILADDFVLVTGRGRVYTKTDLLKSARDKDAVYEHQEDTEQTVRVWGDTAVITALLWVSGKSAQDGKAFDYKLWFSDTYVRTSGGWRYVFGQASLPLSKEP